MINTNFKKNEGHKNNSWYPSSVHMRYLRQYSPSHMETLINTALLVVLVVRDFTA